MQDEFKTQIENYILSNYNDTIEVSIEILRIIRTYLEDKAKNNTHYKYRLSTILEQLNKTILAMINIGN
jgi:hypothetical protein